MRKYIIGLAMLLVAAAPAFAAKKMAKHARAKPVAAQTANSSDNTWRFLRDALPVFLPAYTLPIYFKMKGDADKKARHTHKRKK
jgi:hypothetical protein